MRCCLVYSIRHNKENKNQIERKQNHGGLSRIQVEKKRKKKQVHGHDLVDPLEWFFLMGQVAPT